MAEQARWIFVESPSGAADLSGVVREITEADIVRSFRYMAPKTFLVPDAVWREHQRLRAEFDASCALLVTFPSPALAIVPKEPL